MPLWRDTGSQGGLGTIVVNSLNTIIVELLGFCDFLVQRCIQRLGLRVPTNEEAVAAPQRFSTFGHEMSLEPLRASLRNFVNLISGVCCFSFI